MAKIAFLQSFWEEQIGTMIISQLLKDNGHQVELFLNGDEKKLVSSVRNFSPDIVGFYCTTGIHPWALRIGRRIKELFNILILLGGPHPTYCPEVIEEDGVDIVCRGEAEYAILELLNKIDKKEEITGIENLWVKKNGKIYKNGLRPLIEELDSLPFPDRGLYYQKYKLLRNKPITNFLTSRGCPSQCTFCYNHILRQMYYGKGRYVRFRSIENVVKEIKKTKEKWGIKHIEFLDDNFALDKARLHKFLSEYKEKINIPFLCSLRIDAIDEEIVQSLKDAGCQRVAVGIETGNETLRNKVLKKGLKNEQIISASQLLKKYNLEFLAFNILGIPGETLENGLETLKLNIQIKSDYPRCSLYQPYPGTSLADYALKVNSLDKIDPDDIKPMYFNTSVLKQKDIAALVKLQKFFYLGVKIPLAVPLIKILIRLPLGKISHLVFLLSYAHYIKNAVKFSFFQFIKFSFGWIRLLR